MPGTSQKEETMMKIIDGNLLDIEEGIVAHQVNSHGVMGSGVAVAVRKKYPQVYSLYQDYCEESKNPLGDIQVIRVSRQLIVINVFGQTSYGHGRQTSYDATDRAWYTLGKWYGDQEIHIPYLMGCGLGGGNWEIYKTIVEQHHKNVVAVKLS